MNDSSFYRRRFLAGGVALLGATLTGVQARGDEATRLVVRSDAAERVNRYEFLVDGTVGRAVSSGGSAEQQVSTVSKNGTSVTRVAGAIGNGTAEFAVEGEVRLFGADRGITVLADGSRVSPAELSGDARYLVVDARDAGSAVTYRAETTGRVVRTGTVGGAPVPAARIDPGARVDGGTVRGSVDGVVAFLFTGDLAALRVDGDATVYLDGERIDPESVGEGTGTDDRGSGNDGGGAAGPPGIRFVDCTTVEVRGSYEEVLLEVLTAQADCALGTVYNEEEYVYGLRDDQVVEGTTRIRLPPNYFAERQIVEAAVAIDGDDQLSARNPHADACRAGIEPDDPGQCD